MKQLRFVVSLITDDNNYQRQQASAAQDISVEPAGRTAFPKVAQAAVASGMAWVVPNCKPDYLRKLRSSGNVPTFAVSADNHEIGRIQGRQIGALLPAGGSVLYIQGPPRVRLPSRALRVCSKPNRKE